MKIAQRIAHCPMSIQSNRVLLSLSLSLSSLRIVVVTLAIYERAEYFVDS